LPNSVIAAAAAANCGYYLQQSAVFMAHENHLTSLVWKTSKCQGI